MASVFNWATFQQDPPYRFKLKEHNIPRFAGKNIHVLSFNATPESEDPQSAISDAIHKSWVGEFIRDHDVAEVTVQATQDFLTYEMRVNIALFLTREQEFILRLQHSHELPQRNY